MHDLGRDDEALSAYDQAVALKPDLIDAWLGRANILTLLGRFDEAATAFDKAFALKPDFKYLAGHRLHTKKLLCDWRDLISQESTLLQELRGGGAPSTPFPILSMPSSAADQRECATRYVTDEASFAEIWRGEIYSHERIRIAYVSSDLRNHAVGFLTVGVFERHDRNRFEIVAISTGPDDESDIRHRVESAVDHFYDVRLQSDEDVAQLLRRLEIDIAIDLNGLTQGYRLPVLARRPAPIQVGYLGYAATMGAPFIDYIVADQVVIPSDQQAFYSEKVAYLPHTFFPSDNARKISETVPSRTELGLPEQGFVFCSFNNAFKFNPAIFDIWMRLLRAVAGSVLWLSAVNATVQSNLRREAEQRGVAGDRLVFATRTPSNADHLARHAQADLFLDTLPYNAHTTAADALWAGLPVLTCLGATFAGRVAASLLGAVGLTELITPTLEDYEALALKLARDPSLLVSLKAKLARDRATHPLFDTTSFARHLEAAYLNMWKIYQRGERPATFTVQP